MQPGFNPEVAPAKSSLETMEPQTIINQSYIQDSTADTADYTTILAIAPSMSGQDYPTGQNTSRENFLIKTQTDLAPGWTLTLFSNFNGLFQHLNDNNGATPAQSNTFGYDFALQNVTSAKLGTYVGYNPEGKKTDMDYVKIDGDMGSMHVEDQAYTYAYVNKTISATNLEQSAADIAAGVTERSLRLEHRPRALSGRRGRNDLCVR